MKRAFISGVFGQDGAYLARLLIDKGYSVDGGSRRSSLDYNYRLRILGIEDEVRIKNFDLTDPYNVFELISSGQYDEFYNLAAQSFVGASWDIPIQTSAVDAMGPLYVLDAIRRSSSHTRFYQASTSEMFGLIQEPRQSEATPFYPRSPYGVAKLFAHAMTVNYRESHNLHASSGILFNHESPLRGYEFVTKKITRQLAEIKLGFRKKLLLGNMDAKRDWGFAEEYVEGMWRMLQEPQSDDYVLATGITTTVRDFVNFAGNALDIQIEWTGNGLNEIGVNKSNGNTIIEVDPTFYRPAEVDVLLGDPTKARRKLEWETKTSVADLAAIMAKFDYDEIKRSQ